MVASREAGFEVVVYWRCTFVQQHLRLSKPPGDDAASASLLRSSFPKVSSISDVCALSERVRAPSLLISAGCAPGAANPRRRSSHIGGRPGALPRCNWVDRRA